MAPAVKNLARAEMAKSIAALQQAINRTGTRNVSSISPLMANLSGVNPNTRGLPRSMQDSGNFGPGVPVVPDTFDPINPQTGRPMPRKYEYPVGANLPLAPGQGKLVPYQILRNVANIHDVSRRCIEIRKQEVSAIDWDIVPRDDWDTAKGRTRIYSPGKKPGLVDAFATERKKLRDWFAYPDRIAGMSFSDWMKMAMEEILVVDAFSVYEHPTWGKGSGPLDSDLFALEILDGTCYSADTEVLTRRGWLTFDQTNIATDEYATRNPATKEFEWQRASYFHEKDHQGEMIHFGSRTLDLLVTPNHRMLVDRLPRSEGGSRWQPGGEAIVPAGRLADIYEGGGISKIPAFSAWAGEHIEDVFIPSNGRTTSKPFACTGDQFAAFMGMYLSEGCLRDDQIWITQQPTSKGYEPFRQLLIDIFGFEPVHTGHSWVVGRRVLADYLRPFGLAAQKYVPAIIRDSTIEQLGIFWRYYMLGDGHYEPSGREVINTVSPLMADHLQEIAQKRGFSAAVRNKVMAKDVVMSDGRVILKENCQPGYVVSLRTSQAQTFKVTREHYVGKVYCVSVPNEVLYVRRKGQPAWCGNTIKPLVDYRGARPMPPHPAYQQFLYGTPRVDLMATILDAYGDPDIQALQRGFDPDITEENLKGFRADQLLYRPYNQRTWTKYGFSCTEQTIMNTNLALKRQSWHRGYFDEGDVPAMLIHVPDSWSLEQLQKYEVQWHAMLSGDQGWKHRVKAIPGVEKVEQLKPPFHQMDFDEFLLKITCMGYDMDPQEVGFGVRGSSGGEKGLEELSERKNRTSLRPMLRWFTEYFDDIISRRFGQPELCFRFQGLEIIDERGETEIDMMKVKAGAMSLDAFNAKRGIEPMGIKQASTPNVYLTRDVVPLEDVGVLTMSTDQLGVAAGQTAAGGTPGKGGGAATPSSNGAGGVARSNASPTKPTPARKSPAQPSSRPATAQKVADALAELKTFESFMEKPRARRFVPSALPHHLIDEAYERVAEGEPIKAVFADLKKNQAYASDAVISELYDTLI